MYPFQRPPNIPDMTGNGKNEPQGGSSADGKQQSRTAAKASRREQMRAEMLRRQEQERRKARLKMISGIVAVVVVVAAVIIGVVALKGGGDKSPSASTSADASVTKAVTSISPSVVDAVGNGGGISLAKPVPVSGAPALTADGKPRVLYVGAEFCPFCAAERWAMVAALSRFGTFSNLGQTTSSSTDEYPNTATLSFHGATYTSSYLSFTGVEQTDRNQQPLDTLSAADQKILNTYDTKKYVGSDGGIPFIAYGGKFLSSGSMYDPGTLAGLSHAQIAKDLSNPSSDVTKSIVGSANIITSKLCQLTGQKPAAVCNAAGVKAAAS